MASLSFRPGARLAIPRPANWALWFGVGVGILVGLLLWQQRGAGPPPAEVLRYTRALEPGTVLTAEHLGRTPARLDPAVLDRLVPADRAGELLGRALDARVGADALASWDQLRAGDGLARDRLLVGLAVSPPNAVAGNLRPGDAIRLYAPGRAGPERVLAGVRIHEVSRAGGLILTLAVTEAQLETLLAARGRGELTVVLEPAGYQPLPATVVEPTATPPPSRIDPTPTPSAAPTAPAR
jgi:hypothetical protein